ncbi:FGGY family carbohydrate kinase [Paludicola sp. MB14-C6]|uniref:xylulokinase n=1 Tax=Paludihabitans sp. MB14-C6 TaxID=3070656 RepID=UPI0027DE8806|nr:FGGY family carbohydrate kinase [Paludicola sp. MB14-C6]WMJ22333.1 FGGY family carbohydrate kinase [Paludicola sp. MB14-C6]
MQCILAYDLGTGGVKASLFNKDGKNISYTFIEYETYYSIGGYHEQNPNDWFNAIIKATNQLMNSSDTLPADIMGIGLSGHSLGIVPIDCNGRLLVEKTPIWSDTRAKSQAETFFKFVNYATWYYKTGNGFPAHLYSIFKIAWCKQNQKEIYDNTYKFLGTKDYINYLLTNVALTDYSYASGSGVYDLLDKKYCDEYIQIIGIEKNKLPEIIASSEVIGMLQKEAAQKLGLIEGIPVVCGGVDNACMSLGAGCFEQGDTYASLGSSAWVTVATKKPIVDFQNKPYVWAHCVNDMYIPSVGVFSSGSSLKWVKDNFFSDLNHYDNPYAKIDELAEQSPVGAKGLVFCPQLAGGSSIDISYNVRGGFFG